jgi:hypothetical protein
MRKHFQLPQEDVIFLESLGLDWETIMDQNMQWVIIHDYPLPPGYTISKTDVAIKIETGYPRTPLDMAYFHPPIIRRDLQPINALSRQVIDGITFQRWSRHRTMVNPWRAGIDDLSTHLTMISVWFEQEFDKRKNGITA